VALLTVHAVLDNASSPRPAECEVSYATTTAKKKAIFAVHIQTTWAVVIVRNKLNKQRTKKRVQRRPACALTSCAKDHWTCPHAAAVAQWCVDLREATPALQATTPSFVDPFKHVLLPSVVQAARVTTAAQAAGWAAFSDEARGRCARNLLPCVGEVADCSLFDQLADSGRAGGHLAHLFEVLCETKCFSCGNGYSGAGVKHTAATLHTLRGRVAVTIGRWSCLCGQAVPYDGAHEGLFATSINTVFTQTYLDVITQMVFTGHGTLLSAASVLCFLLESTKSMSGSASGLARQTFIIAAHRYSRTLIVPASLFRCTTCKQAGYRPYVAVIADGQVLSILRNQSQALVCLTEDVVGVPLDAGHGSCLASAGLRAAIRKRMTAERQAVVRLTKDENAVLKRLADELSSEPPPHAAGRIIIKSSNLAWAAAFLFFSFYTNEKSNTDPGPDMATDGTVATDDTGGDGADAPVDGGAGANKAGPLAGDENGGGEGAAAVAAHGAYYVSKQVPGAVGTGLSATVEKERWRIVHRFLLSFLGHPVFGALTGLPRKRIRRLAEKLAFGAPLVECKPHAKAVESVGIVWPFLRLIGEADDVDAQMTRAIGELLLFTCGVDSYWETLWRNQASVGCKAFEDDWRMTSAPTYAGWAATRAAPVSHSSPLSCSPNSAARGLAQALEVSSGHVWPDLDPVRPFITDSKADAVNAARAVKVTAGREALEAMLNKELGSDDCRHAFLNSQTFMPGVENFLCPCGLLIGFDFLDRAESPAHVLASLMQRFPLLPSVVYFDIACQMARNASRRVPWLVNRSGMAASIDRAHRLQKQHGGSPIYDADAYPCRSVRHRTACAESRHSINKAYKSHLVHLRQDHFMMQMRLLGAFFNLRVKMRHELGRELNHRLACAFFHERVHSYCDRRSCCCPHGRRQEDEAEAAAAAAAVAEVIAAPADAAAPAACVAAAADAAPALVVDASGGAAGELFRCVDDAVAAAVTPAAQAALSSALSDAAHEAAVIVSTRLGSAEGQAAVAAAYRAANVVDEQQGDHVGVAGAAAAARSAACAPLQADVQGAVYSADKSEVEVTASGSGCAAAQTAGDNAGVAAGRAAGAAAVRASGLVRGASVGAAPDRRDQVGIRLAIGQPALQAALRGALLAAGVMVKEDEVPVDSHEGKAVGDFFAGVGGGGVKDGGGDEGGDAGGDAGWGRDGGGAIAAAADQVNGVDVPRVYSDTESSDGQASCAEVSDTPSCSDSE